MRVSRKSVRTLLFCTIAVVCTVAVLFLINEIGKKRPMEEVTALSIGGDFPVTENLDDMKDAADYIVIGKYTGFDSSWNMSRNPLNISEEDEEHYVEGRLYQFSIEEVLKGDIEPESVLVNHEYMEIISMVEDNAVVDKSGRIVKAATKENHQKLPVHNPLYIEPELNETYMLFLQKDEDFGNYYGAIEPFSIKIVNGIAELQCNLIGTQNAVPEEVIIDGNRTILVEVNSGPPIDDNISGLSFENLKQEILSTEGPIY